MVRCENISLALQNGCDKIIKKNIICKFAALIFLVSLLFSTYAGAENNVSEEHEETNIFPDYGPEVLEKAADLPEFIAARGTMPVIAEDTDQMEWMEMLVRCTSTNDKIMNYLASADPVHSFGTTRFGYLAIELDSDTPEKVNDSLIDEMYQIIDEAVEEEEGISDIPVVFMWSESPQADENLDENYIENYADTYIENDDTQNEDDTQSAPGFTSVMLVMCILLLTRFRK